MTWEFFERQMNRLRGLKFAPASYQTHWEALQDMPEVLLEAAVSKAQPALEEFPAPKMLKMFADLVRASVLPVVEEDRSYDNPNPITLTVPIPHSDATVKIPLTRYWKYYCDRCGDTGWVSFWCGERPANTQDWLADRLCGRHKEHDAHGWSQPCGCVQSNPDILRRKERQAQLPARGQEQ